VNKCVGSELPQFAHLFQRTLYGSRRNVGLQRPRGNEARQGALASNAIEERDTLRLGAEADLASGSMLQRELHQPAADPLSLILGIDKNLGDCGEEVAIREDAHRPDEAVAIPRAEVDGALEGGRSVEQGILARPNALGERDELLGGERSRYESSDMK
jgi:hypothetical protein